MRFTPPLPLLQARAQADLSAIVLCLMHPSRITGSWMNSNLIVIVIVNKFNSTTIPDYVQPPLNIIINARDRIIRPINQSGPTDVLELFAKGL